MSYSRVRIRGEMVPPGLIAEAFQLLKQAKGRLVQLEQENMSLKAKPRIKETQPWTLDPKPTLEKQIQDSLEAAFVLNLNMNTIQSPRYW